MKRARASSYSTPPVSSTRPSISLSASTRSPFADAGAAGVAPAAPTAVATAAEEEAADTPGRPPTGLRISPACSTSPRGPEAPAAQVAQTAGPTVRLGVLQR